ncbi:MAG TPA: hypothetical protein VGO89_06950 [Streptomyces sp.]|jgi:hypothetical protein|nr:hypothetical protein [Streptomyces sp.]
MPTHSDTDSSSTDVIEISAEQLADALNREARTQLDISGTEFTRRWRAGEYQDSEDPRVTAMAMLLSGQDEGVRLFAARSRRGQGAGLSLASIGLVA